MSREIRIAFDWTAAARKLKDVVAKGFTAAFTGEGLSGAVGSLIGAAASFKVKSDPGAKAYAITLLSFAWALDDLVARDTVDPTKMKEQLNVVLSQAREAVDSQSEIVPVTFLERPTTLPLYIALRDAVVAHKTVFRGGVTESDDVFRRRFDAAFERGVFEIHLRRPELWRPVEEALLNGPAIALQRQLNWDRYRRQLIYDFFVRPTFGQETSKISLAQLYVPLRGYWRKNDFPNGEPTHPRRIFEINNIGMLDELLDSWIDTNAGSVKLIGGGPGSGKSTTLKALAARISAREDWRPLFIPLQHISLDGDLRNAINNYFVGRTDSAFTEAPLSRESVEDGTPILLIFDGLDELSKPGDAANEVVTLFSSKLNTLLSQLVGDDSSRRIKAVISGRMPAFQAARKYISPTAENSIEVIGFGPLADRSVGRLWSLDQRGTWWRQYARLTGADEAVPAAFKSRGLAGITQEPLLCYLLVLSGFATSGWDEAAKNLNRVYEKLVDSIWERAWGEGAIKRQGPGRELSKRDFNSLMQAVALAAWHGGDTRVASEESFHEAISQTGMSSVWEDFKNANGPDITNLALNFYLKSSETSQRGFEFTHKSFGDYLTARAILDFAVTLPELVERKTDLASSEWLELAGRGDTTAEILTFLRNEVRLRVEKGRYSADEVASLKSAFEALMRDAMTDGFAISSRVAQTTWRLAEAHQSNAELCAWSILNACSLALEEAERPEAKIWIEWPDGYNSLRESIVRCSDFDEEYGSVIGACLSNIVAPQANLSGLFLVGADLHGSNFSKASFSKSELFGSNLTKCNLGEASFYSADLDACNLSGADLRGANLTEAPITDVRWSKAKVAGAIIDEMAVLSDIARYVGKHIHEFKMRVPVLAPKEEKAFFDQWEYARSTVENYLRRAKANALNATKKRPPGLR